MADRHSTIIIVDDRVTNRKVLAGLATNIEPGIEVETFPEAQTALKHLVERVPDLIVTDFNMPGMNGAEFIRSLRTLPRCGDVPVIVVTSYEDKEYRLLALDAGATDYLISPVDHREFTSRARNLLALRRQRDARERAELQSRAKTEFLANMSHELRTPLNAIIGFADMMHGQIMGPLGGPKYVEYAEDIGNSARHLRAVIQNILDMSLLEQGKLEIMPIDLDIGAILVDAARTFAGPAEEAGLQFNSSIPEGLPRVRADETKLRQILFNLLSNAVKFTPKGGRVGMDVKRAVDGALYIAVSDTGIGMSPEEVETARVAFAQVFNDPFTKKYQGAGLGLSLASGLVQRHGGELMIKSAPGRGTTMTVKLPAEIIIRQR